MVKHSSLYYIVVAVQLQNFTWIWIKPEYTCVCYQYTRTRSDPWNAYPPAPLSSSTSRIRVNSPVRVYPQTPMIKSISPSVIRQSFNRTANSIQFINHFYSPPYRKSIPGRGPVVVIYLSWSIYDNLIAAYSLSKVIKWLMLKSLHVVVVSLWKACIASTDVHVQAPA